MSTADFTIEYILLSIGAVMVLFWVFLYVKGSKKYDDIIQSLTAKEFLLHFMFFIGFALIDLLKINIYSTRAKKRTKHIAEIKGEKFAKFYFYAKLGGQFTYIATFMPVFTLVSAMTGDLIFLGLGVAVSLGLAYYLDYDYDTQVAKRREELLLDFPRILSKLALLLNAGLPLRAALTQVAGTGESELYKEMQQMIDEFDNGVSEFDGLRNFAERCSVIEIRKFASSMMQNLQKGNAELAIKLKELAEESWQQKRHDVKRLGENASSKLLIPILIMFAGILAMIIVPIFSSM